MNCQRMSRRENQVGKNKLKDFKTSESFGLVEDACGFMITVSDANKPLILSWHMQLTQIYQRHKQIPEAVGIGLKIHWNILNVFYYFAQNIIENSMVGMETYGNKIITRINN